MTKSMFVPRVFRGRGIFSALLAVFSFVNFVDAELMLRPPGLEDGDQYRLVFTTSETTTSLSGDIEFYNDFVQTTADAAPIVGSWGLDWTALMSTQDVNVRTNTETTSEDLEVPVYRIDGLPVAFEYSRLYASSGARLLNPLSITELETLPSLPDVWTGTLFGGLTALAPVRVIVTSGIVGSVSADAWNQAGSLPASGQAHLYAISNVITVPEPNSAAVMFWSLSTFCFSTRRNQKVR